MTPANSQLVASPKSITFIGNTGLNIYPKNNKADSYTGELGGDAAWASIAASMGVSKSQNSSISIEVVTTLSQEMPGEIHNRMRELFKESGIKVTAPTHINMPIDVYNSTNLLESNLTERLRDNTGFDVKKIQGIKNLRPDIAVFSGPLLVQEDTYKNLLELAARLREEGTLIILDINPRTAVEAQHVEEWARVSNIVKVSQTDKEHMAMSHLETPTHMARQFLDWGPKLVFVTANEGAQAYWREKTGQERTERLIDTSEARRETSVKKYIENNRMYHRSLHVNEGLKRHEKFKAGAAFTAGIALACLMNDVTSNTLDIDTNTVRIIKPDMPDSPMTKCAESIGAAAMRFTNNFLATANMPDEEKPAAFRPLATGSSSDALIKLASRYKSELT